MEKHITITTPFTIGDTELRNRLIAGPLAGVSTAPYRLLIEQHSQPAICYTEMIAAGHLVRGQTLRDRYLYRAPGEQRVCYQISGDTVDDIAGATREVTEAGADFVDLNCGCPKPKIRKKGFGSAMLAKPEALAQCIRAMRENTHLPIGIKIRIDGKSNDQNNAIVADIVRSEGCDFVSIHGRHWTENYDTPCHYDQVAALASSFDIPVIGNGDVKDMPTLKAMHDTGVDAIMISRGMMGRPWLIAQLMAEVSGGHFTPPTLHDIGELFLEHICGLIALDGEFSALLQARKFAKYYARDAPHRAAFCEQMYETKDLSTFKSLIGRYFN